MSARMFDDEEMSNRQVLWIRAAVEPRLKALLDQVVAKDRHEAMARAVNVLRIVLGTLCGSLDLNRCDPGHGAGHVVADYANALRLFTRLDIDPKETFIGFLGGVLHDLGCSIMNRYEESSRVVRHAEAAGLLIEKTLRSTDLNEAERLLTSYVIMAHTHYLKPSLVTTGIPASERHDPDQRLSPIQWVVPYTDLLPDGKPFYPVWTTRWVDRLDCSGPRFPARHYLTMAEEHEDFTGKSFEIMKFDESMKPLSRERAGHATMLSHMMMFANSQNNNSPYGKWDFGGMTELRDLHLSPLRRIIQTVEIGETFVQLSEDTVLRRWTDFLTHNVEPSEKGLAAAVALDSKFRALPAALRSNWIAGFWQTMEEYKVWSESMILDLEKLDPSWLQLPLPGVSASIDVRDVIRPHKSWALP